MGAAPRSRATRALSAPASPFPGVLDPLRSGLSTRPVMGRVRKPRTAPPPPQGMEGCCEDHPAPSLGGDGSRDAIAGLEPIRAMRRCSLFPGSSRFPRWSPEWAAGTGPLASTVPLPPGPIPGRAPLRGRSQHPHGRSAPRSAPAELRSHRLRPPSAACPPGPCPAVTSPQSQWQRGVRPLSRLSQGLFFFLQYIHNILV